MPDRTLKCVDCGADFIWDEREQHFFKTQGLTHEPKRCVPCRAKKRARNAGSPKPGQDMQRG
jgi:hypothetical protein